MVLIESAPATSADVTLLLAFSWYREVGLWYEVIF